MKLADLHQRSYSLYEHWLNIYKILVEGKINWQNGIHNDSPSNELFLSRETIVNTVDQKLKSGDVDDYYLLMAAIIYSHEQVLRWQNI